jgi:hypothetical protein
LTAQYAHLICSCVGALGRDSQKRGSKDRYCGYGCELMVWTHNSMLSGALLEFAFCCTANTRMTEVMTTIAPIPVKGDSHGRIIVWSD